MSMLSILENVEIELDKVRKAAYRIEDELILYLIDMTILAVKRKAVSECAEFKSAGRTARVGARGH
jgi:hypothetical protein